VWKLHAVYWLAFLLSAGLALPDQIVVHGFLTAEGKKISKSGGNSVDPFETIREFGSESLRYYLLKGVPSFDDGDFSQACVRRLRDSGLAGGLGNLLSRVTALCEKAGVEGCDVPARPEPPQGYGESIERFGFGQALQSLWDVIASVNRDLAERRPWELISAGHGRDVRPQCAGWLTRLHRIGFWIKPFLPHAGQVVLDTVCRRPIKAAAPLFPRLE